MLLQKFERQREITRDRPRVIGANHFITIRKGGLYYSLEYTSTPQIHFQPYSHPFTHPIGYVFTPPPVPPLKLVGPTTPKQATYVQLLPIEIPGVSFSFPTLPFPSIPPPPPITPTTPGPMTPFIPAPNTFVGFLTLNLDSTPKPLVPTSLRVREFTLFADPANAEPIKLGKDTVSIVTNYLPLQPGASLTLNLDDLSKVVVQGPGKLYVFYLA